ncbi:MAG: VapB-type antitoxin [Thermoproteota archaeon]|nr:VapB-type antitoxin [Candidatus Brockarchaeota archaeon]
MILGTMAIVRVDERGRMTIPREIGVRGTRAIVIPAGSFFLTIPLPQSPREETGKWLITKKSRGELKKLAEAAAKEDAVKRAKRRKQL